MNVCRYVRISLRIYGDMRIYAYKNARSVRKNSATVVQIFVLCLILTSPYAKISTNEQKKKDVYVTQQTGMRKDKGSASGR